MSTLLTVLISLIAGCETGPDLSNLNKPTPVKSDANSEQELSGVYSITGSNENSANNYDGNLTISNDSAAYRFNWQTTKGKFTGTGVQMGDAVAVAYSEPGGGKDCGVVLYRIAPDGSLDGKIAKWGDTSFGTEKATRTEGTAFDGKYSVTGTTDAGKPYQGTIEIVRNGSGYQATWRTGADFVGFGIWRGDRAAIGFGGTQCSFAIYQVMSGGNLEGRWGSQRTVAFGTENAKRQ